MTDDPLDHDVDWVKARHKCSVREEFVKLKRDLESFVNEREKLLLGGSPLSFYYHDEKLTHDENKCSVQRGYNHRQVASTSFTLDEGKDCILVNNGDKEMKLTLTLNNDGGSVSPVLADS